MELTLRQAEDLLRNWRSAAARRDEVVWAAIDAGVSKSRISELSGLARSTIDRILAGAEDTDGD